MHVAVEIVVRMGDSILDVAYVSNGHYVLAGESLDLESVLAGNPRAIVRRGLVDVFATRADAPKRSVPLAMHVDPRWAGYLAISLVAHLVLWAATPPPDVDRTIPALVVERRPVRSIPVQPVPQPRRVERGDSPAFATNGGGSPSAGPAGAAGGRSSKTTGAIQIAQRQAEAQLARASATERGREAGVLASRELSMGFDALVGTADLSSGFDRIDVRAPLYGGEGAGRGTFGLARDGAGLGGECTGGSCGGIIGTGRYGTLSNGDGSGTGWGGGRGGMRGREAGVPTVVMCGRPMCVRAEGGLDKAIIRRYVRRALPKIQYCYERELVATPALAGELRTEFLIAVDGSVVSATATGMSESVASCVSDVIRAIQFPRAHQGGSTRVTYPFTLRQSGA